MLKEILSVVIAFLISVLTLHAAVDVTETTPLRLGPAAGVWSSPLAIGYRLSIANHYSIDFMASVPKFVKTSDNAGTDLSGMEFGGLVGYAFPIRLEENIGIVLRPQVETSLQALGNKTTTSSRDYSVFSIRPGAFFGVEVFMEEVGIENFNISLGITTGMEFQTIKDSYEDLQTRTKTTTKSNRYRGPLLGETPFGATVGLWWYF